MDYSTKKAFADRRKRKIRIIALSIIAIVLAVAVIVNAFYPFESWRYRVRLPEVGVREKDDLRVHFLDVGQGDATVVEFPDGKVMLIDGGNGNDENTAYVIRYLNALKKPLDYLLVTHPDSDHTGGLAEVMKYKTPSVVYLPGIDVGVNEAYSAFLTEVKSSTCVKIISETGLRITGENYDVVFLNPDDRELIGGSYQKINGGDYDEKDLNDSSAVILLEYAGTSVLFCGDITSDVEEKIVHAESLGGFEFASGSVDLSKTDVLKVAHHGSMESCSETLLNRLHVSDAVISCGKWNPYGHPSDTVLYRLGAFNVNVHRTDEDGTIVLTCKSDGTYSFS